MTIKSDSNYWQTGFNVIQFLRFVNKKEIKHIY